MIKWMHFPINKRPDETSKQIIRAFQVVEDEIDSTTHKQISDEVLAKVRPELEKIHFDVEKSKKKEDLISVPVLFGINGKIEKSFEADAYYAEARYVIEVEAGRALINYQFLKDFFEACTMSDVEKLCIAVRNDYRGNDDFTKICTFFDSLYASGRLGIPLSSLLIIGY
ncbi:hypothetical protein SAMN02910447_03388 [Ruminococcus sp. YE71]|uniref:hypothetical protein n=1 Tax=unclassified Ruminococcus TaxID=2608920 RepID=UPI00088759CE|nr:MULTISPECIES: hypothetical protein [unclassified Ruminococcus]SDA31417.1 hypothetical protein SAMN02910446_03455 [Ruminococcus sp. YE78]SFW51634.1 hypothetical protein SAMN02910447_03388 [Ruminococcus sp. YE71]